MAAYGEYTGLLTDPSSREYNDLMSYERQKWERIRKESNPETDEDINYINRLEK